MGQDDKKNKPKPKDKQEQKEEMVNIWLTDLNQGQAEKDKKTK